jgi:hypothetical protein
MDNNSRPSASLPGERHGRTLATPRPTLLHLRVPRRRQALPPGKARVVAGGGGPPSLVRGGLWLRQCDALDGVLPAAELVAGAAAPGFCGGERRPRWLLGQRLGQSSAGPRFRLRQISSARRGGGSGVVSRRGCCGLARVRHDGSLAPGSVAETWRGGGGRLVRDDVQLAGFPRRCQQPWWLCGQLYGWCSGERYGRRRAAGLGGPDLGWIWPGPCWRRAGAGSGRRGSERHGRQRILLELRDGVLLAVAPAATGRPWSMAAATLAVAEQQRWGCMGAALALRAPGGEEAGAAAPDRQLQLGFLPPSDGDVGAWFGGFAGWVILGSCKHGVVAAACGGAALAACS